ncbi:MAG TPA: DUF4917 family protein [Solirubrobacteraceae bacterium]|nr:DUF4917 family protein [Solirubrobacteraceae bacterium]
MAPQFDESVLLLGNGLSINVWPQFDYGSLFDHAQQGGLTSVDLTLFDGDTNFETVLAGLNTAIRVNDTLGIETAPVYERYRGIQQALGRVIREVHVTRGAVPDRVLEAIRAELAQYEWIFTTSYDLLLYWAMACGGWKPFIDGFRYRNPGTYLEFDPEREVEHDEVPVYFLHGALHLVVNGSGVTWKLRGGDLQTILDQFGDRIEGDPQARPLLVTEGSARDKLRAIEGNSYLAYVLARLRGVNLPVVVFGSRLGKSDEHLIDALNEHPRRAIAISMQRASKREMAMQQSDVYGRLETDDLIFFDAETHPLGDQGLRCGERSSESPPGRQAS